MTNKPDNTLYARDGSKYGCVTDGNGNLVTVSSSTTGTAKQLKGSAAPDGSIYFTLANGSGALV